jgi:hypothetical protein
MAWVTLPSKRWGRYTGCGTTWPPPCTALSTTSDLPGARHRNCSTQVPSVGPPPWTRVTFGIESPLRPAKYSAVDRAERTVPRLPKPNRMTTPPSYGLIASLVPLTIIIGTDFPVALQCELSSVRSLAANAATAVTRSGCSQASRNARCPPLE